MCIRDRCGEVHSQRHISSHAKQLNATRPKDCVTWTDAAVRNRPDLWRAGTDAECRFQCAEMLNVEVNARAPPFTPEAGDGGGRQVPVGRGPEWRDRQLGLGLHAALELLSMSENLRLQGANPGQVSSDAQLCLTKSAAQVVYGMVSKEERQIECNQC